VDENFRRYRRNKREVIPLIPPPAVRPRTCRAVAILVLRRRLQWMRANI